ncbi:MAG: methylenetetrahydrofolate reductase [NAD(P)H] [Lachnospiraceae bacterium]|nr:methylenetetrahydrofolate reductase [NAD(P)H] [Lachnospiraceae bacterium]
MIKDKFTANRSALSFEVFPPKKDDDFANVFKTIDDLAALNPDFISVTYGAGGSNSKKTLEVASYIQNEKGIDALCHMTCVGYTKADLDSALEEFDKSGLSNMLALRGDRPQDMSDKQFNSREFMYANEMVGYIRAKKGKEVCIGGACYPEKHPESKDLDSDIINLKRKVDAGLDFMTTQMFFDNELFFRYEELLEKNGIAIPVTCGIMPITRAGQLGRSVTLSGSSVPKKLSDLIALHGDDNDEMFKYGTQYAADQIRDLRSHGVRGIHIYAMNNSKTVRAILDILS